MLRIRHEIAHSFGGREVRGDGTARDVRLYPRHGKDQTQFAPERLREFVLRMLEATQDGAILEIQAGILRKRGYAGHDAWRQQQEAYEEAKRRLMEHGTISEQGGAEDDG